MRWWDARQQAAFCARRWVRVLRASTSPAALDSWGWRIPFLLGLLVGVAGYILRRYALDRAAAEKRRRAPIVETLHDHWRIVVGFIGLTVFAAVTFLVGFVYRCLPN